MNFKITCRTIRFDDDGRRFCNIHLTGESGASIGDMDSWTLSELMESSILDMLLLLESQSIGQLLQGPTSEVFGKLRELRESAPSEERKYYSLPRHVECFDGEVAYLIRQADGQGRFIWRDYSTSHLKECLVFFDQYLLNWRSALQSIA